MAEHLGDADVLVVGGAITTGRPGEPDREALAIRGDRVLAVGSEAEVRDLRRPRTEVIDVAGRRVIPGLIDSHIHVVRGGLTWNDQLDWSRLRRLADALQSITEATRRLPAGAWVTVVGGWHPGQFEEGRGPTADELSSAAPAHPAYVQLLYESATLNDAGMRACGLDGDSGDPPGGLVERADDGRPTGSVRGVGAFRHCLGVIGRPEFERQVEATEALMSTLSGLGLTGVVDPGGMGMSPEAYRPLYELWRRRPLPVRTRLYLMPSEAGREREQIHDYVRHLHPGFGDDLLKVVGIGEIPLFSFTDLEGLEPLVIGADTRQQLKEIAGLLAANNWPLHMHAVRNDTITAVLDVWEEVNAAVPLAGKRFSLAHADAISEENLQRVRALGAGIGVQNRLVFRAADSGRSWGEDVVAESPPLRRMLELGIPVGAGTDATVVTPYNPWLSLWWLVSGRSVDGAPPRAEQHRLTRAEALHLYTRGSAWFSFEENHRGTLAPGMLADLAVLSDDYFTVPEDEIPSLSAALTMVGGRVVTDALR
jgi:predicted amidohydrolase YtcJ